MWWLFAAYLVGAVITFRVLVLKKAEKIGKQFMTLENAYGRKDAKQYSWTTGRIWAPILFGTVLWPVIAFGFLFWRAAFPSGRVVTREQKEQRRKAVQEYRMLQLRQRTLDAERRTREAEAIVRNYVPAALFLNSKEKVS
jgi:hypothetical protein